VRWAHVGGGNGEDGVGGGAGAGKVELERQKDWCADEGNGAWGNEEVVQGREGCVAVRV